MDRSDVILCKELLRNSRVPYTELAKAVGISVPAVHKRVRELVDDGIIGGFVANIDITAVGGLSIMAYGRSKATNPIEVADTLAEHDSTWMVLLGGGNQVFVNAFLRSAAEMETYRDFFMRTAAVDAPTMGIHMLRPEGVRLPDVTNELTPLELRIISSLHHGSRKQHSEIAEDIGISARTVASKLNRMVKEGRVRLTLDWRPAFTSDTISLFELRLADPAGRSKALAMLKDQYPDRAVMVSAFTDIPDLIIATVWTPTMHDVEGVMRGFLSAGLFSSVVPHIVYSGRRSETWKDRLIPVLERPASR